MRHVAGLSGRLKGDTGPTALRRGERKRRGRKSGGRGEVKRREEEEGEETREAA